jgi:hypothetical protein
MNKNALYYLDELFEKYTEHPSPTGRDFRLMTKDNFIKAINEFNSPVKPEVIVKLADLESIKYIKRMKDLLKMGDDININARLLHLQNAIEDDFNKYVKRKS